MPGGHDELDEMIVAYVEGETLDAAATKKLTLLLLRALHNQLLKAHEDIANLRADWVGYKRVIWLANGAVIGAVAVFELLSYLSSRGVMLL